MNLKAILVGMNLVWWPRDGGRQDSCSQTSTDCAANRQRVSKHGNDALIWRVQENRNHLLDSSFLLFYIQTSYQMTQM
ncbi:hypothetical protein M0657_008680 [Pyricularia oryzae]|nr:hypothetical protein M0657_008680 [Pyricularia oryzae]KAI7922343.1 hypothetical protein M9X92_004926 [Pyricularia oryzae]